MRVNFPAGRSFWFSFLSTLLILGCTAEPASAPPMSRPARPDAAGPIEVVAPLDGDNPRYPLAPAAPPAAGQSLADPRFGTTQTRACQTERLRHEYSRHDPFNRDRTLILLQYLPDGEWRVYRTTAVPYDRAEQLVRTIELA